MLGKYTFSLAESSKIVASYSSLSTASLSLEGADESSESGAKKLSGTILHPKDQLHFFFLLLVWTMILVATGMESFLNVANFLVAKCLTT